MSRRARFPTSHLLIVAALCAVAVPSTAFAQASVPPAPGPAMSGSEIEAIIEGGVQLREQGRDEEALRAFRRAFDASKSPRAQAQMGLAEQALGRWIAADKDVAAALAS